MISYRRLVISIALALSLVGCAGSDNFRRTQKAAVNLMLTSNISAQGKAYWPFLQIQNLGTRKVYELHRMEEPFEYTQSYRGRVPVGRYKLRSLYRERFPDEFFSPFSNDLGEIEISADTDLGIIAHWLSEEQIWSSRYRPYSGRDKARGWRKPIGPAQQRINEKLTPLIDPLIWKKRPRG